MADLHIKKGTRRFHQEPGHGVLYQVLTRQDAEAFAALLSGWLRQCAGLRPAHLETSHRHPARARDRLIRS